MRLENKVALISGASSGIGLAIADLFRAAGARVVAGDIATASQPDDDNLLSVALDVAQEEDWVRAVAAATARFGRLDILVNNAGIGAPGLVTELALADWRRVTAVNLDGVFLGIKHAAPALRAAGGGAIVNISSMMGMVAAAGASAYCASKAGVTMLTKAAALELAVDNIRVNSIHPGYVVTPLLQSRLDMDPARGGRLLAQTPIGRLGTPRDIAEAVLFLASDAAGFMTASAMMVDGGYTAL